MPELSSPPPPLIYELFLKQTVPFFIASLNRLIKKDRKLGGGSVFFANKNWGHTEEPW